MAKDFQKEIDELEKKLRDVKREKERFDAMPPEHRLADEIHEVLCRWNHTDGCSYLYENWTSPGTAKSTELRRVRKLLEVLGNDHDRARLVVEALRT